MVTVTFTIPDAIATELNQMAVLAGYPNAKAMVVAYLKYELQTARTQARDNLIKQANPVSTDDAIIS